jgi:hypothetical protein
MRKEPDSKCFALEQSISLLTIQLAAMNECLRDGRHFRIEAHRNTYKDRLVLSGVRLLPTTETTFEDNGI